MLSGLKELIAPDELARIEDPEERSIVSDVDWQTYEALLNALEDNSHYRVTYLNGILEIVSPSIRHEKIKKRLATLLERYLISRQIQHTPLGSATLKDRLKNAGAEPDECYCIGAEKDLPDLAIEVNITSGNVNKLATYQQLGVEEVWLWEGNQLKLYSLRAESLSNSALIYGYELINLSELLPDLNITLSVECTLISDQLQAIDKFDRGIN